MINQCDLRIDQPMWYSGVSRTQTNAGLAFPGCTNAGYL